MTWFEVRFPHERASDSDGSANCSANPMQAAATTAATNLHKRWAGGPKVVATTPNANAFFSFWIGIVVLPIQRDAPSKLGSIFVLENVLENIAIDNGLAGLKQAACA